MLFKHIRAIVNSMATPATTTTTLVLDMAFVFATLTAFMVNLWTLIQWLNEKKYHRHKENKFFIIIECMIPLCGFDTHTHAVLITFSGKHFTAKELSAKWILTGIFFRDFFPHYYFISRSCVNQSHKKWPNSFKLDITFWRARSCSVRSLSIPRCFHLKWKM